MVLCVVFYTFSIICTAIFKPFAPNYICGTTRTLFSECGLNTAEGRTRTETELRTARALFGGFDDRLRVCVFVCVRWGEVWRVGHWVIGREHAHCVPEVSETRRQTERRASKVYQQHQTDRAEPA